MFITSRRGPPVGGPRPRRTIPRGASRSSNPVPIFCVVRTLATASDRATDRPLETDVKARHRRGQRGRRRNRLTDLCASRGSVTSSPGALDGVHVVKADLGSERAARCSPAPSLRSSGSSPRAAATSTSSAALAAVELAGAVLAVLALGRGAPAGRRPGAARRDLRAVGGGRHPRPRCPSWSSPVTSTRGTGAADRSRRRWRSGRARRAARVLDRAGRRPPGARAGRRSRWRRRPRREAFRRSIAWPDARSSCWPGSAPAASWWT
jgi:hypothetical protein